MKKVKFIYIGKNDDNRIPKSKFYAMKLSKKSKEKLFSNWSEEKIRNTTIYYPKTDNIGGKDELFIRGLGWKKFSKTNKVTIPLFSGNIDEWDDYLAKYGKDCLFYSLTGYLLDDMDACAYNMRNEFLSLLQCKGGIVEYQKYVENIECIQEIQTRVFNEKLSYLSEYERKYFINDNLIRPYFKEWLLVMPPYLNTPIDDVKLKRFYRKYRSYEIKSEHSEYNAVKICEILNKEIEDGAAFPICMSDRMKMLFGDKCNALYQYILNHFK